MNNKEIVDIFFEIIKPSVGEPVSLQVAEKIENVNLKQLFNLVRNSDATTMTYDGLYSIISGKNVDEAIIDNWKASAISLGCYQVQHRHNVKDIYEKLEKENLNPVLFKGIIIGDLYEDECFRISKDTDILVDEGVFDKAKQVLEKNHYIYDMKKSKANVAVFYNQILNHKVELHKSLYEDYKGEKIDILNKLDLSSDLIYTKTKLGSFRTLNETNHLIFQIFHIIKHFTVQGITIKYLTDLKVFIDKNYDKINWTKFDNAIKLLEYKKFMDFVFYILDRMFNLKKLPYPIMNKYQDEDVMFFLEDVVHKGDIEEKNRFDYQMITVLEPYMVGNAKVAKSSNRRKIRAIFPIASELSDYYMYAKKHRILLPVAWVHRIIIYFKSRLFARKKNKNLMNRKEKFDTMEYRIKLLKITGLVK